MTSDIITELNTAREKFERLRTAVTTAKQRAAETETQRATAENQHAETVANALLDGGKTPAKPAALSALQSADDAADSAVAILEHRLSQAEGDVQNLAWKVADAEAKAIAATRVKNANLAYDKLFDAMDSLIDSAGLDLGRLLVSDLSSWGGWNDVRFRSMAERLRQQAPECRDPQGVLQTVMGEHSGRMPQLVHHVQDSLRNRLATLNEQKEA